MKIDLEPYRSEPREMNDNTIDLVSTSLKTAKASSIPLNRTDMIQLKFEPVLVENDKEPSKSVSGKLIYERKRKKDTVFPTEKLTRQSAKTGDFIEISLSTSETFALFHGLKELYDLYSDIGQTPARSATYTKVDSSFRQFQSILQNDPSAAHLLMQHENFELVKLLMQIITQTESIDSLRSSLKALEPSGVSTLTNAVSIEGFLRVLADLESNMNNADEEFWQKLFVSNQWILSQIFSCPCTIFEDKAYVGGKGIANTGGNICDFIYRNKLTQNIAIIDIKTPEAPLIGGRYRGTYSLSTDLSGAVNQVLNYKDKLLKDYYGLVQNSGEHFEALNPTCVLITGKIDGLERDQISAFENYRNCLVNVIIVTFDELLQRIRDVLDIFSSDEIDHDTDEDDNLPF